MKKLVPVKKILIANRGEIALRIIRTAKEMGIDTVTVYAANDAGMPWTGQSTETYPLGEGDLSRTYLNIPAILDIARCSGADAIHPGYGFLSENSHFAGACRDRGITFIGPSTEALKLMGDKLSAHRLAESIGIAVPEKIFRSPEEILAMNESLVFPLLVKAAAGGGGKGMRLVRQAHELTDVLVSASSEALNSFGDERIYLEQYLPSPRHIEVQILGDMHGNLVHLFERECSIQRRHQKVIEEAPAIAISESTRDKILLAALAIGRAVGYYGAGTVEFLIDDREQFVFLEMNPRIQVEHGITELVTGFDIVRQQILVASGMQLSFAQHDVKCMGHAIEARVYAEDPENRLLPAPGKITHYQMPAIPHVRIDSAVSPGTVIPTEYDPLIAKVLVHAASREEAIHQLSHTLDEFVVTGVRHNIPLLHAIVRDIRFIRNSISTTFLQDNFSDYSRGITALRKQIDVSLWTVAAAIRVLLPVRDSLEGPWKDLGYWRLTPRIRFRIDGQVIVVDYHQTGKNAIDFYLQDKVYSVTQITMADDTLTFQLSGKSYTFYPVIRHEGVLEISNGILCIEVERFHRLLELNDLPRNVHAGNGDGILRAPLPGRVNRITAMVHDRVQPGDPLLVIESMKLENSILANCSGQIQEIRVNVGDQVSKNDILIHINPLTNNS